MMYAADDVDYLLRILHLLIRVCSDGESSHLVRGRKSPNVHDYVQTFEFIFIFIIILIIILIIIFVIIFIFISISFSFSFSYSCSSYYLPLQIHMVC